MKVVTHTTDETEQTMKRPADFFEAVLSTIKDYVYCFDKEGRFFYANKVLLDLWGLTQEEALGKTMADLEYPKEVEQTLLGGVREVFTTGQSVTSETFYTTPSGANGYYENVLSPVFAEDGSVAFVTGSSRDVTERKRAEKELQLANKRFRIAEEAANSFIYDYDPITGVESRSDGFSKVLGYSDAEVPGGGATWETIMHPHDVARVRAETEAAVLSGASGVNYEYRVRHKNGAWVWVSDKNSIVRNTQGEPQHIIGSIVDISERKRAEEALLEANERLQRLSDRQKRFVADAAHELRAPLTAIQGNLQLMKQYDVDPAMHQEMLGDVRLESERLTRLVNDLLAIARGDSGLMLEKAPLPLNEVLLEAWRSATLLTSQHQMTLGNLDRVEVIGNRDRLKQLVLILLENAVKYTPPGGRITLGLEHDAAFLRLCVQDTGIGIDKEDLPHIFERFYRADKARTRAADPTGTGLGLSIAEWIVAQHDGKIWLESEPGKGTTAWVELPLAS